MSRISLIRHALVLVAVPLLIAACGGGEDSPPACPTDGLMAPIAISPDHIIVPDLRPVLAWDYPDECIPGGYRIEVTDYGTYDDSDTISGGASGAATTWLPADDLLPATDYEWRIAPINGYDLGPFSMSTRFWTGPLCDAATMPAPTLTQPADGSTVDNPYPPLMWTHAEGCLPEYYSVDLWAEPASGGPSLVADFHSPAKAVIPTVALADCTTYSWRVTAHRGAATPPISPTWSFSTNFSGACPGSGSASISGAVWHDLCAAPWDMQPTPEALPAGCRDRYNANGIREAGEPGLEGVRVDLGVGACPASGAASTLTAADGSYRFEGLGAGTFCVSIDALSEPSTSALIPGGWSTATLSESVAGAEVVVPAADSAVADIDFGWDFQFLPEPDYGPTPTPAPAIVSFNKNAFCRKGPNIGFKEDMAFSQGEQALALGRNDDGSWLLVKPLNLGVNCWVSASLADMPFDWRMLEVKATPALTLASISGVVWNDKCQYAGGAAGQKVVLGEGCVDLGDEQHGEFGANGVRDSGEPGFSDVRIQLGSGSCPATGLAETTTGSDGSYRFSGLEPGTYCITLDVMYDGNPNRLIPGEGFTYPSRMGGTLSYWTVKGYYGDAKSGIDFGWEFQHLG
jgi:hypothetical protein